MRSILLDTQPHFIRQRRSILPVSLATAFPTRAAVKTKGPLHTSLGQRPRTAIHSRLGRTAVPFPDGAMERAFSP
jgi:hypothetical protein